MDRSPLEIALVIFMTLGLLAILPAQAGGQVYCTVTRCPYGEYCDNCGDAPSGLCRAGKPSGNYCNIFEDTTCDTLCLSGLVCQQVARDAGNFRPNLGRCCDTQLTCAVGCTTVAGADGCTQSCDCPTTSTASATTAVAATTVAATGPAIGGTGSNGTSPSSTPSHSDDGASGMDTILIAVFAILVVATLGLLLLLIRSRRMRQSGGYDLAQTSPDSQAQLQTRLPTGAGRSVVNSTFGETRFGAAGPTDNDLDADRALFAEPSMRNAALRAITVSAAPSAEFRGRRAAVRNQRAKLGAGIYDDNYVDVTGVTHATWEPDMYVNPDDTEC